MYNFMVFYVSKMAVAIVFLRENAVEAILISLFSVHVLIWVLLQKLFHPIDCCAVATFAGSTAGPAVAIEGSMINFYSYIYGLSSLFLLIWLD